MISYGELVRPVVTKFLPFTYGLMLGVPVVERVIRQNGMDALRGLYLPYVIGQPILIAAGYGLGLIAFRRRYDAAASSGTARHAAAAVLAVVSLGVLSVFSQGAGHLFVITACVAAGFVASLMMFLRAQRRVAVAG